MFNNVNFLLLEGENKFIDMCQNSALAERVRTSRFYPYLDKITFGVLILLLVASCFVGTGMLGALSFVFILLNAVRVLINKGEKVEFSVLDCAVFVYFLFAFVSLMGSSLFLASLKGFLKMILYIAFYFSFVQWFKMNKSKIKWLLLVVAGVVVFEAVIAILQNMAGVQAISGWQDMSAINPEDVIARAYGTLKPYNPNLLAGYLVAGIIPISYFLSMGLLKKNVNLIAVSAVSLALCALAIFYTGCRGAYIALFAFIAVTLYGIYYYVQNYKGGFSKLKKRYKNLIFASCAAVFAFVFLNPAIYKRIFSIFAFRGDSSISFRMNVYSSSYEMFLNNPFIGIGLGNQNFRETYGLYMKTGFDALSAYNIFLETACEMGIFGLLAFCAIFGLVFFGAYKYVKTNAIREDKILVLLSSLGLLLLASHGLIDTVFYRPQIHILFWIFVAIVNVFAFSKAENK